VVEETEAAEAPDAPAPAPELVHGVVVVTTPAGDRVLHPTRQQYVELVRALAADGYLMCVDLTAVDFLSHPGRTLPDGIAPERFEVVVGLLDHGRPARLRLRVQVPESDAHLPSLWRIHPGVDALEREVFDMFGISFDDHPDLTRILMPEDWVGHPLRKDYDSGRIPVQFKGDRADPGSAVEVRRP
jgi:NADH-quinone oxidoreductase subunit C